MTQAEDFRANRNAVGQGHGLPPLGTRVSAIDALERRLTDIYSGALGGLWVKADNWPGAEQLSRIVPAVRDTFELNDEEEGYHKSYLCAPGNLDAYDTPSKLAEFLHDAGIRA